MELSQWNLLGNYHILTKMLFLNGQEGETDPVHA
jgi:hypothetical protein